ncbi:hypothetical protein [Formosa sp. L2A11]|uniref:hypothetical protein n=1 Tax=Formosa sp. L2A11 TaxID=2686363 RepID=UPI0018EED120|nr:hypothetical protein [Formosa sp. L2A11]
MKKIILLGTFVCLMMACQSKKNKKSESQEANKTEHSMPDKGHSEGHKDRRPDGPPTFDKLISEMDANKDGKLEQSEVKGPLVNVFSKIDTDGDGFISKSELENAPKPEGEGGQRPPNRK